MSTDNFPLIHESITLYDSDDADVKVVYCWRFVGNRYLALEALKHFGFRSNGQLRVIRNADLL